MTGRGNVAVTPSEPGPSVLQSTQDLKYFQLYFEYFQYHSSADTTGNHPGQLKVIRSPVGPVVGRCYSPPGETGTPSIEIEIFYH